MRRLDHKSLRQPKIYPPSPRFRLFRKSGLRRSSLDNKRISLRKRSQNYNEREPGNLHFTKPREEKNLTSPLIKWLKFFGTVLFLSLAIYLLLFSKSFSVKDVFVEGNKLVEADKIINITPRGDNIFLLPSEKIKEVIISQIPEIKDIQIYRGIPNALKIVVLEHDQGLIWKSGQSYYLISSQGVPYYDVTLKIAEYPNLAKVEDLNSLPVTLGKQIATPAFVTFVNNINKNLFEATNIEADYFSVIETTIDVTLKTKAGFYVKFDSLRSSKKQLYDLKMILVEKRQEILEYIDLRVPGWAYYK